MDAYGSNQLTNLQQQLQQLQRMMSQPKTAEPVQTTSTIPFVDGLNGAKTFLKSLGPNSSAAVFDKDDAVFYTLSVDANGNAAPIKLGRFVLEDAPAPEDNTITKADFDKFREEIREALASISNGGGRKVAKE